MSLSPIIIFAYRRPEALQRLFDSLTRNPEWLHSEVFIFIDAAKHPREEADVETVVQLTQRLSHPHKHIIRASHPKGLARSVIEGVSHVIEKHQRAIVLEDDLECTPDFLAFMNAALRLYKDHQQIFSLSGYTPPISWPGDYPHDITLLPRLSSLGWGIWADRWQSIDWQVSDFQLFWKNPKERAAFSRGGEDLPYMLYKQQKGLINSWAIRACYALYRQEKYCLYPRYSKCRHVYTKHSTHLRFYSRRFNTTLSTQAVLLPDTPPPPDVRIIQSFARYHRLTPWRRLLNRLRYR
ncbi:MAG: hypothetical protein KatS3mg033_2327 [Thermonema sp.]|uniref:glycosyltransferase n=1 Tax=Thermonema sp. TaxID=2231181 RepID=UPI0021DD5453|nr:glycosyltransferase [Thermonema sp.]GIV40527.1 MAG: hypothetical protein KatS3mg033_2327 [Thermonema sp.]